MEVVTTFDEGLRTFASCLRCLFFASRDCLPSSCFDLFTFTCFLASLVAWFLTSVATIVGVGVVGLEVKSLNNGSCWVAEGGPKHPCFVGNLKVKLALERDWHRLSNSFLHPTKVGKT